MLPIENELFELLKFPARGIRAVMIRANNGAWVDANGSSRGLSGPADLEWLVANRATTDAVLVSAKTAILENYQPIRHRPIYVAARLAVGLNERAKLVCVTNELDRAKQVYEVADFILSSNTEIASSLGNKALIFNGTWSDAIRQLNENGLIRVVCEGGPALLENLVAAGALNQLALTTSTFSGELTVATNRLDEWTKANDTIWKETSGGFNFELIGNLPTWSQLLPKHNYRILREAYTEPAFSVPYEKEAAAGYYVCGACGNKLFDADKQFNAHCGWPAFWKDAVSHSTRLIEDFSHGMRRTEVVCAACESHLGHVFYGEGFGYPTDARYCINAGAISRRH